MNGTTNITISELRDNLAKTIEKLSSEKKSFVISQRSRPKAILADYEYFTALEESLMDYIDEKDIKARKNEPSRPLKDYIKERFGTEEL